MSEKQAYVGKQSCGCIVAAIVDSGRLDPKKMAKVISTWIEVGFTIERMPVDEVRYDFTGCTCTERNPLPLFESAGVTVDEDKPAEAPETSAEVAPQETPTPSPDAPTGIPAPTDGVIAENAVGEKVVVIESTGEMLPLSVIEAAQAQDNGDLHAQVGEILKQAEESDTGNG